MVNLFYLIKVNRWKQEKIRARNGDKEQFKFLREICYKMQNLVTS